MANRKNLWSSFQKFFSTLISPFMTPPMPHVPGLFISPSAPTYGKLEHVERRLETQRLVHEAECQQLLARIKALELGGK
jgi:hypothetical protein